MEWIQGLGLFSALVVLLAMGVPVAFSLGALSIITILIFMGPDKLYILASTAHSWGVAYTMACLVVFIFMAHIINCTRISDDAFDAADKWLSWLPGGLLNASVGFCTIFAAISGSSMANAATIGLVGLPKMLRRGYDKYLSAGVIAAGGTLGILIPPSITMILYALLTGQSIGALFIAGIFPGILMSCLFVSFLVVAAIRRPEIAPREARVSWKDRLISLPKLLPMVALIVMVLGSIYGGICTPTEAASIGASSAIILAIFHRRLTWKNLMQAFTETGTTVGFFALILVSATCFAFVMSYLDIPQHMCEFIVSLPVSRWVIMAIITLLLIFLGCFLDAASIMVLTIPTIFPIITGLGFDPIWFGIILVINMELGGITPPVGLNLFILKGIAPPDISLMDIARGAMPFMILLLIGMVIIMVFPEIALWLPSMMR